MKITPLKKKNSYFAWQRNKQPGASQVESVLLLLSMKPWTYRLTRGPSWWLLPYTVLWAASPEELPCRVRIHPVGEKKSPNGRAFVWGQNTWVCIYTCAQAPMCAHKGQSWYQASSSITYPMLAHRLVSKSGIFLCLPCPSTGIQMCVS